MEVVHKLKFDLLRRGVPEIIHAVQGDTDTRVIEASLYAGGQPFEPPEGTVAAVRFRTAANTGGTYDMLQDGAAAYSITENIVTATLAPEVLSAPGNSTVQIALISGSDIISTFSCIVAVQADPSIGCIKPVDYTNITNFISRELAAAKASGEFDGVGIVSIEQTTTSTASGGANVLTVTMTDGTTAKLRVLNGAQGEQGPQGEKGETGAQGPAGPQGPAGADGKDATDSTPEYVRAEAERVATVVQSRQHANTISFFACSDLHYSSKISTASAQTAAMTHMGQAMRLIREAVHIDFAAMLGDMIWDSGTTAEEALADIRFVNGCLSEGFGDLPVFRSRGNHDDGSGCGADFTKNQIYSHIGIFNKGAVFGDRTAGYCYRDLEAVKLRVICLNSSEEGGCWFSSAQVAWLAQALNMPDGYKAIILSHHPLDWGKSGGTNPIATLNAAASTIICTLHGHIHNHLVGIITGTDITRASIANGCDGRENQYDLAYDINWKDAATYSKIAGTAADTTFDVLTFDFDTGKIWFDAYGAGYSRVISFGEAEIATYAVANTLTNVTSSNAAASVAEGASYTATITADAGYTIKSVIVTMGGADITSTAYSGGKISIPSVTGDIAITAVAEVQQAVSYTNLVPLSTEYGSNAVYNGGKGCKDGVYLSSSAAPYEGTDAEIVTTGYIPYATPEKDVPGTIEVKGAEWAQLSHVRLYFFDADKTVIPVYISGSTTDVNSTNYLQKYYTHELLGDKHFRLTPIYNESAGEWIGYTVAGKLHDAEYIRFSLKGTGTDLIITVDEPIQ